MELDEAIKHAEEVAEEKQLKAHNLKQCRDYGNPKSTITSGVAKCEKCAEEHRQLAEWLKDYKRLLEQQPNEDAISRQAMLEYQHCLYGKMPNIENHKLWKFITELPSVAPKAKWIPVSERLPDERDWYLGIFKEPDTGWVNPIPYICDYVGCETEATTKDYWILNGFTNEDEHIDYYFNLECVAWRPITEPYQEEKE